MPVQEITISDLLKKNGYQTGIIGKWHPGFSQQFLPLQRGFDYHYGFTRLSPILTIIPKPSCSPPGRYALLYMGSGHHRSGSEEAQ
ncbi:sulfatase-like hydrolase/transferase [Dyadobacter sp. CY356]|uniref:sulfatase-like hydrolase/transferase n=1 Tax=Dyadobacter sp. CY356 TaxID=2906442 RepID=UPI0038D513E5